MPTLADVVRQHTTLQTADLDWLQTLLSEWQLLADLFFADLVLWLPDREGLGFWAGAQMRPTTAPTQHLDDLVGSFVPRGRRPLLDMTFDAGRIRREGDPELHEKAVHRVEVIPVRRGDRVLGLIRRDSSPFPLRTPGRLERVYLQTADELAHMISDGRFPPAGEGFSLGHAPRVGDGLMRLDTGGVVTYASPNAQSAYRRLGLAGDLVGAHLGRLTARLLPDSRRPVIETLTRVVSGRQAREVEVETDDAVVVIRVIPLLPQGTHVGALVLARDVTEVRRRERELITKEATIREIHHRVKNNLQTVAALLRLQARRIESPDGKLALNEAVRRVGTIALVHETLSHEIDEHVDFDEITDQMLGMVAEVSTPEAEIDSRRVGTFGKLDSDTATPLAMVVTELAQNAVRHGFGGGATGSPTGRAISSAISGGVVEVRVSREEGRLIVEVCDNGVGVPVDFVADVTGSLGLNIVRTLVRNELGGEFRLERREEGGTRAVITLPAPSA